MTAAGPHAHTIVVTDSRLVPDRDYEALIRTIVVSPLERYGLS